MYISRTCKCGYHDRLPINRTKMDSLNKFGNCPQCGEKIALIVEVE